MSAAPLAMMMWVLLWGMSGCAGLCGAVLGRAWARGWFSGDGTAKVLLCAVLGWQVGLGGAHWVLCGAGMAALLMMGFTGIKGLFSSLVRPPGWQSPLAGRVCDGMVVA